MHWDELTSSHPHAPVTGLRWPEPPPELAKDCRLPEDVRPARGRPVHPPRVVLLTGVTGFLGGFLLAELLTRTDAEIRCLVRANSDGEAASRLLDTARAHSITDSQLRRVSAVRGRLNRPGFDLDASVYQDLAASVDAVFHCAADVNLLGEYQRLRRVNVEGVLEILRFTARDRPMALHHVSTTGVLTRAFADPGAVLDPASTLPLPPEVGYCQTKWAAEVLLAQAAARGLSVSIYRPGAVFADSTTGRISRGDWTIRLAAASVAAGCSPSRHTAVPVGTVDFVAEFITELSLHRENLGGIYHVVHPEPLMLDDFFRALEDLGFSAPLVPYEQWLAKLTSMPGIDRTTMLMAHLVRKLLLTVDGCPPGRAAASAPAHSAGGRVPEPPAMDTDYFGRMLAPLAGMRLG